MGKALLLACMLAVASTTVAADGDKRGAATQPTDHVDAEFVRLWREINVLRGEIDRLSRELAAFKAAATRPVTPPVAGGKKPADIIRGAKIKTTEEFDKVVIGMTPAQISAATGWGVVLKSAAVNSTRKSYTTWLESYEYSLEVEDGKVVSFSKF